MAYKIRRGHQLGTIHLLHPLSRLPLVHWCQSFDLFKFTLTEIRQGFLVHYSRSNKGAFGFKKLVLAGRDRVFGIGFDGKVRYWNGEIWTRIKDQIGEFVDIMVLKGLIYALDSQGIVWWISSYSLSIFRYGTSLTNECGRDLSLVECCGELYIVDRLLEDNVLKRKADSLDDDNAYVGVIPRITKVIHDDVGNEKCKVVERECPKTVGFKVYKVDEELGKWVEVKSLGDSAVVMATDTFFSVLAREYYGCVPNSIYFIDEKEVEVKVFRLDDGSIASMFGFERSCFQLFVPSFL
ncbi:unnamed protein product [Arabidopsis lyrata]|uniref:F-box protein At2g17690 n=1 Tax=Arabidopsis lyrata subsp. lyrata TaxID=81972 RepID=UPI000A29B8B1|nr:F-box protein At2g17690 [Arabidopsis lyrata subsp. lyrata]CAH8256568.1 unnamed protein product [Arabidopsis lyrata]|eukprot:XP_020889579.1 F-box protein At2g17690 [Arabidopsis lyrata subsp. lyrata]